MFKKDIVDNDRWLEYLEYKTGKDCLNKKEKKRLEAFILDKRYLSIAESLAKEEYTFSTPTKHIISKISTNKKRVVYKYSEEEMIVLKYISYLLYDYSHLFSPNLYSFRKNRGVKTAIQTIQNIRNINKMYGYKVDIKNYFNSIDINILLNKLKKDMSDKLFYALLSDLLSNEYVMYDNHAIVEKKGVMAGVPISAFLANYYIKEIDQYFWNEKLVYFRYADDIILFCNTDEERNYYQAVLTKLLGDYNLQINTDKEYFIEPYSDWEFLGFSFSHKEIDVSQNTIRKIKGKIRRSARGIRRWMLKNNVDYQVTLKAMNKRFNHKFYGIDGNELTWKYWFFPTITTSKSLKIIDNYMQEHLRYIVTGKYNKKNYEIVPYSILKECNYKPLVHEYYKQLLLDVEDNL